MSHSWGACVCPRWLWGGCMRRFKAFVLVCVLVASSMFLPGVTLATDSLPNEQVGHVGYVDDLLGTSEDEGVPQQEAKVEKSHEGEAKDLPSEDKSPLASAQDEPKASSDESENADVARADEEKAVAEKPSEDAMEEEGATIAPEPAAGEDALAAEATGVPSVEYCAHVENIGWQNSVKNGAVAGTFGRSLRVEALRIWLRGLGAGDGGLEYRMHVQNIGWMDWARDGEQGGTSGQSLRVEAFQLRLYGKAAESYDVWYRVHAENTGWMAWAKNGQLSGTEGKSLRLEAIQIRIVPRDVEPEGLEDCDVSYSFLSASESSSASGDISITTHVQNIGWSTAVGGGATAGSLGSSLRLEAFRIDTSDPDLASGLTYRTYVQNIGWQDWVSSGQIAGTTGMSLRVEALAIQLSGRAEELYDVYYRAHVQNIGWMAWAKNGESTGSHGLSYRCEAIQVRIVPKGQAIELPSGGYRGKLVNAMATRPPNLSVKLVPELQHGTKPFGYQRCIVMHDTTEYRPFDYWIDAWIRRGGSGTQFMVKEDGSIRQYADLNQICWHASGPTLPGLDAKYGVTAYKADAGSAMNQCSIGIEIDHVIDGRGYPEAQLDAIDALVAYIDEYYGFESTILQHKDYHTTNGDCSEQFQGYLRHLQQTRTTR